MEVIVFKIAICVYLPCDKHSDVGFLYTNRRFGRVQPDMFVSCGGFNVEQKTRKFEWTL